MTQLVTRIDDELAAEVDALVAEGVAESRSDAVRRALHAFVDVHRRRRNAEATIAAYTTQPQTDEEIGWSHDAAVRMIEEEPW